MQKTLLAIVAVISTITLICQIGYTQPPKSADDAGKNAGFVWWEGESPAGASENLKAQHSFDCSHENLSGGKSFGGTSKEGTWVEYEVDVPRAGKWFFYLRKFWYHGPFRFQWNAAGDWVTIDREHASLLDNVKLNEHCINWVSGGQVELKQGKNKLRIEAIEKYGPFVLDCFVLAEKPFKPSGKLQPGQKFNRAPDGWFPFEPDYDTLAPAALDLRAFNEPEAGSLGRIIAKADDLVFEKTGQKARFWGVTACPDVWLTDKASMDYMARRLAKLGVNMVRFHVPNSQEETPGPSTAGIHYLFTALKKHGIYSYFNWYCTACGNKEFGDANVWYFDPKAQEKHKAWAKCLLGTVNPHTGIPLAKDPACAVLELIDEDSLLFWTFKPKSFRPEATAIIEKRFGDWLKARYGSLEKAAAAWGDGKYPRGDNFSEGRVGLYDAGMLTGQDWAIAQRNELRAHDQAEFLTTVMRDWNAGTKKWLREELGYEGLVLGSNWQTADSRILGPLDQYANMGVDLTARNTYFGGQVKGKRVGHAMDKDDYYTDISALKQPEQAILMHIQCAGYPHMLTEGGWVMPNRFRAEEPLLMSCYGSLQGMDGYFPFVLQADWLGQEAKWPIQTPVTAGQYPAAAIIFRNGYVKEGPVAINEALALKDLYALKGGALSQAMGQDMAHNKEIPDSTAAQVNSLGEMDPLAFFVGRVVRTIGENPGKPTVLSNLGKLIDRQNKIVKSATGELTLDYGRGVVTANSPCAQCAAGFLQAAGPVKLADVTIDLKNEYGAVMLVSLDGKPLKESGKILLQVMTEEKNFGWTTKETKTEFAKGKGEVDCLQITNMGEAPICVKKFAGNVSLSRADAGSLKVTPLDFQGYVDATKKTQTAKDIQLLDSTMYYIIGDAANVTK